MTMPIPEKTWQFSVNNLKASTGDVLTDYRQFLIGLVQILTEFPINPWVVTGSSDGGAVGGVTPTAGMDGVNRWKTGGVWDPTRIVWGTVTHGWIVLKQTGLFSTCELCIDLNSVTTSNATIVWGFTGFTGGTISVRPTVTTSITTLNSTTIGYLAGTYGYLHGMQSTDGECTRILGFFGNAPILFWIMDKVKNPVAGWTYPVVVGTLAITSFSNGTFTDTARLSALVGTLPATLYMTGEGLISGSFYDVSGLALPSHFTGEYYLFPIGLLSQTLNGTVGRHGELYDLWWGPGGAAAGSPFGTWPDDTSRKFWSPDHMTFPWDGLVGVGSAPLIRY